jgi:phosphatidylserine decarboxylase
MITERSWQTARRYVLPPLVASAALLLARRRRSGLLALGAAGATLAFFRDPERPLEPEPDVVYAAADGFVTEVEEAHEPWVPSGKAMRISTFLSIHNVHVNRSPVRGRIVKMEELPGRFVPAFLGGAKDENHQNRVAIDGPKGRAVVVQIAGMVARKISPWIEIGESVKTGQRIGLIHFGSRTDVLLPAGSAEPLVRPGDRVRAGQTPIARYKEETTS